MTESGAVNVVVAPLNYGQVQGRIGQPRYHGGIGIPALSRIAGQADGIRSPGTYIGESTTAARPHARDVTVNPARAAMPSFAPALFDFFPDNRSVFGGATGAVLVVTIGVLAYFLLRNRV